jgi:signal transduction histidine kinase
MMRRVRLRSLLLLINLLILILPLAGIWFLRLYESALIRQTESELIAQAAVIAGAFDAVRHRLLAAGAAPAEAEAQTHLAGQAPAMVLTRAPGLDLAVDPVLPPPPDPAPAVQPALPLSALVGQELIPVLRAAQPVTLASIRVVDPAGVIVGTTGNDLGLSLAALPEMGQALNGAPVSAMRWREHPAELVPGGISRGSKLRVFVALPLIDGDRVVGAVMLSRTPHDLWEAIYGKRRELAALAVLLITIGAGLAIIVSRVITRPLEAVVRQARRVADGGASEIAPIAAAGTREVAELSAAVARMAETLARRADYIRSFAAHVSHEFKTPLASAKGALELLGDHDATMSIAERTHFLDLVGQSLDRLDRLVRRLVDLARADVMRRDDAAPVAVLPVVRRVAERYRDDGLDVRLSGDAAGQVVMPEEGLEIVVATLLDNARQHAGTGAHVVVATAIEGEQTEITISDDGVGISLENAKHVFEPFFTTARTAGGTGLGLPIVQAIVTAAGGTIELVQGDSGARFRLLLPSAHASSTGS